MTKSGLTLRLLVLTIAILFAGSTKTQASHAAGADLTYRWLSGNTYEVTAAFYRDCGGITQPTTVTLNYASVNCGVNQNVTLPAINNGPVITFPCNSVQTTCSGGSTPGIQQWLYRGNITLPSACSDWKLSYSVTARNCAITTIVQPSPCNSSTSYEPIYVEALLNNLNAPQNSSPTFSNVPISFVCLGQNFNYNHGVIDLNGDSLTYELITPLTSATTSVTYLSGYSASSPILSSPAFSINPNTGDLFMNPTAIQVSVVAIRVKEYRNGILIGSVIRDMQIYSRNCTPNFVPFASGINGTSENTAYVCPGSTLCFNITSGDPNPGQTVVMTWNSGIPAATFNISGSPYPTGQFCWTPQPSDARSQPYTFTVTVRDDACPLNGVQTYSFSVYVPDVDGTVASSNYNGFGVSCNGNADGSLTVTPSGGIVPFTYSWNTVPAQTGATATGLAAGNYQVVVTDSTGCQVTLNGTITEPAVVNASTGVTQNATCANSNGSVSLAASGGVGGYSYNWSNGVTTAVNAGLLPGTYTGTVTDANGCSAVAQAIITNVGDPSQQNVNASICSGGSYLLPDGSSVSAGGVYTTTLTSSLGCDSVIVTTLSVNSVITSQESVAICDGDSYLLPNGQVVSTGGVYISNLLTSAGCDSIITTTLTVNPIYAFVENVSVCDGNSYMLPNGNSVSTAGTYVSMLTSVSGCDSVITTNLSLNPIYAFVENISICDGASYVLPNGNTVNAAGSFVSMLTSVSGCDSVITTNVTVNPVYALAENVSICDGSTYTLPNGQVVSTGGVYTSNLQSTAGCDSIITTTLTINAVAASTTNAAICAGGNYTLPDGVVVNQTGTYTSTLQTQAGCDSIVTTNLTVNDVFQSAESVSICSGQSYVLPSGQTVSQPGVYTSNLTTQSGCDSIVTTTLSFIQVSVPIITAQGSTTFCAGGSVTLSSSAEANYQWLRNNAPINGATSQTYVANKSGNYKMQITTSCGLRYSNKIVVTKNPLPVVSVSPGGFNNVCIGDSILLTASVNLSGNVGYQWYRNNQPIAGATNATYYAKTTGRFKVVATNLLTGCTGLSNQSRITVLNFTANITHDIPLVTCYDDITMTLNTTAGAGAIYQWRMDGIDIPGANGLTYVTKNPGVYNVKVTAANGCSKISNSLTVSINCNDTRLSEMLQVSPNPAKGQVAIETFYHKEVLMSAELYDMTGRQLKTICSNLSAKGYTKVTFNTTGLNAGIYLIRVSDSGIPRTIRLIVE